MNTLPKTVVNVCASGGGGNFQAILDAQPSLAITVNRLIVDRNCGAIDRADKYGIEVIRLQSSAKSDAEDFATELAGAISTDADLVVLAGFLSIIPQEFFKLWKGPIINTHPSLLPKHGGIGMVGERVQQSVIDSGDSVTGCTVHFVNEIVDGGDILCQKVIPVKDGETAWDLGGRVFKEENALLVSAIKILCHDIMLSKQH